MRGHAKNHLNNYQGAIEDCTKAIYISPKDELAYAERGHAKGNLNDYQGAIEDYSKVIEINPDFAISMGIDEKQKKVWEILKALNDI
jgi:tetratricopeptide (TPR) repeat protein